MATVTNTQWLKDGLGGGQDESGIIIQTESVIITFDSIVTTVKEAIADSGFFVGQVHRDDDLLVLQPGFESNVHSDDNAQVWQFDLTYSTAGFNSSSRSDSTYTTEIGISKWTYNRTVLTDQVSGETILLPTGEIYDSSFEEQVSAPIISVTVKDYTPKISRIALIGSINDTAITIAGVPIPKYCAMLDDYSPQPHRDEEGYLTFRNTFKIKLKFANNKAGNSIGFTIESLAASFNQVVDGKLVAIKVEDPEFPDDRKKDVLAATPQMVDTNGELTSTPFYQEWVINNPISFSQFGLPTSYPVS